MRRARTPLAGILPAALAVFVLLPGAGPGQPGKPDRDPNLLALREEWAAAAMGRGATALRQGGTEYRVANVEYTSARACDAACGGFGPDVHVLMRYDKYATVLLPAADRATLDKGIDAVAAPAGFVQLNIVRIITPPPPPAPPTTPATGRAAAEKVVRGGFGGRTGKGVVIAVIDSGVDFRHPDFVRTGPDGKRESRFLAVWDTTRDFVAGTGRPGPVNYVKNVPVGTVFLRDELTADLDANRLGNFDRDGHGTGCAGIAAGNGAALEAAKKTNPDPDLKSRDYRGVAPEADLIAVRVSNDPSEGMPNTWLLNAACDWIDTVARDRPAVISCSFGGHAGGHDGSLVRERWLSTWVEQRPAGSPARLVFIAAGNEAADRIHASAEFARGKEGKVTWELDRGGADIEVYIDATAGTTNPADFDVKLGADTKGRVVRTSINPVTRSAVVRVAVESGGSLRFTTNGDKTFQADAYLYADEPDAGRFDQGVSNLRQIGNPATAVAAFAVGSYDFDPEFLSAGGMKEARRMVVGELSGYSNAGYLRRGGIKPDVAAPGQWHTAAVPSPAPEHLKKRGVIDLTGRYQAFNGTSAACPYAAGVAALVLEKKPTMTAKEFRELLKTCGSRDKFTTETLPNPRWGYGKLDLEAVGKLVNAP